MHTSLDTNERHRPGIRYEQCKNCTKAYKSQKRCPLPRVLVLTQVSHLCDKFGTIIPKNERCSSMLILFIRGLNLMKIYAIPVKQKISSSSFPSTKVHSEYSFNLYFISNHQVDEKNRTEIGAWQYLFSVRTVFKLDSNKKRWSLQKLCRLVPSRSRWCLNLYPLIRV